MSKSILIVDDHILLRKGLVDFIKTLGGYEVIGEAESYDTALSAVDKLKPDFVLLDITMPGKSGFEILKKLKSSSCPTKVILFTMHLELPYFEKALEMGADGFVTKDKAPELLKEALSTVTLGQKYFDRKKVGVYREFQINMLEDGDASKLSSRELEVLRAIVDGKSLTALAAELKLSVKTVSSHRSRLLEKVNLSTNAELVKWAMGVPMETLRS